MTPSYPVTEYQKTALARLMAEIFQHEYRQFQKQIDDLVRKNNEAYGEWENGFIYLDRWYGGSPRSNRGLHMSQQPFMARMAHYQREVENNKKVISQVLGKLLANCSNDGQVRNEMPECVVALVPDWLNEPRTTEPAQSIQGNPRDVRQYQKVLLKIEAYCAMRYLC